MNEIIYFLDVQKKNEETTQRQLEKPKKEGKWRLKNDQQVLNFCTSKDLVALLSWDIWFGSNYGNIAALSNMCVLDNFVVMLLTWNATMMSNVGY